jgi:hypothetical protein
MRLVISACTNKAFSCGLMPLARLKLGPLSAANDNDAQSNLPRNALATHAKRAAYGRIGLILAVLVLVGAVIALPLLQGLVVPIMTASEARPTVIRGSPIAPVLLQPQENG